MILGVFSPVKGVLPLFDSTIFKLLKAFPFSIASKLLELSCTPTSSCELIILVEIALGIGKNAVFCTSLGEII